MLSIRRWQNCWPNGFFSAGHSPRLLPNTFCPRAEILTAAVASLAIAGAVMNGLIAHGVLRPMLEARGIRPWTLRDTLGSTPLVLLGGALVSGALSVLGLRMVLGASEATCVWPAWVIVVALFTVAIGGLMIRLGLLALRKLL